MDRINKPDLSHLVSASRIVGSVIRSGTVVAYESTVYPGVIEGICRQQLEEESGLVCGEGFFFGYSPERVNPGDQTHSIDQIVKVVSCSSGDVTDLLAEFYGSVVFGGVFRAASIATAEGARRLRTFSGISTLPW